MELNTPRTEEVIITDIYVGERTQTDPKRVLTAIHSKDGKLLAQKDSMDGAPTLAIKELPCDCQSKMETVRSFYIGHLDDILGTLMATKTNLDTFIDKTKIDTNRYNSYRMAYTGITKLIDLLENGEDTNPTHKTKG